MKVNYFDLGLYSGEEMKQMLYHFFPQIGVTDYSAYGFEACEAFYDFCRDELKDNENVKIHHLAINDKNEDVKLFNGYKEY